MECIALLKLFMYQENLVIVLGLECNGRENPEQGAKVHHRRNRRVLKWRSYAKSKRKCFEERLQTS